MSHAAAGGQPAPPAAATTTTSNNTAPPAADSTTSSSPTADEHIAAMQRKRAKQAADLQLQRSFRLPEQLPATPEWHARLQATVAQTRAARDVSDAPWMALMRKQQPAPSAAEAHVEASQWMRLMRSEAAERAAAGPPPLRQL